MLRRVLNAHDAIDGQTSADDVGESKPAPEVFLTAMRPPSRPRHRLRHRRDRRLLSQHELSEAGSLQVYRDVAELLAQVFTSPLAPLLSQ